MRDCVRLDIADHIATVSLVSKTMPPEFFDQLKAAFVRIAESDEVRAVLIHSESSAFTYGLDLQAVMQSHAKLFAGGGASERTQLHALIREWQGCMDAVYRCPVPVIAAIHSHCIGGGIDLITCADVRLATRDASFSVRETRVAIVADLGTLQRLPHLVGEGHARELALTGCDIDAERAAQIGLVNHVYDSREALVQAAKEMAAQIAANPPLTVRGVKRVLDFGRDHGAEAGLAYVGAWNSAFLASEDLGEAFQAFATKREPKFRGR